MENIYGEKLLVYKACTQNKSLREVGKINKTKNSMFDTKKSQKLMMEKGEK